MFEIRKITQRYDPGEDRVAFTVQDPAQKVLALWLTQRLASVLSAALVKWLESDFGKNAPSTAKRADREEVNPLHPGRPVYNRQALEQWIAQSKMKSDSPVDPGASMGEALIREIDLQQRPDGCTVIFKWAQGGAARLPMDATQLRQWLIILYRMYRIAGWPLHAWPAWITAGETDMTASGKRLDVN